MNLSYGSRGDSVKQLQQMLNGKGYKLDVDGIFGNNTLSAVRDYQSRNGLQVDGIVGSKTFGSLQGPSTGTTTMSSRRSGVSDDTYQHQQQYEKGYQPSDAVKAAQEYLNQVTQNKPGEYQSPYAGQLDAMYEQILGRKPFSYDLNADMLYQQYRDQYKLLGQQAMMDTMGQAAGLTGGYGSSYSQNAGQQAYQGYLQQLNDKVPELYQLALQRYQAEGNDLMEKYGLLNDRENTAYGRYRDQVGDWADEYARAYGRYGDERNFDYGSWSDMLNYWTNKANSENEDWWQQTQFDYQKQRDAAEDAYRWAALNARSSGGGGGGSGSSGTNKKYSKNDTVSVGGHQIKKNQRYEVEGYGTLDGKNIAEAYAAGAITFDKNGKPVPTGRYPTRPFNMIH